MFTALRNYNYKLFWYGQVVSLTGSWMQTVGLSWLVLRITNSPIALGKVTMLQFLPILLFSLIGGVVADRVPKRRLLLFTQSIALLQALALAILVSQGIIKMWEIEILAFMGGLNAAFDNPTRQAFVVEMVGREDLANAVALNSGLFNAARVVGPAIGGLLIDTRVGIAGTFYANSASFVAALIALSLMKPELMQSLPARSRGSMLDLVLSGWRYCFSLPQTILIVVMMAVIGTFGYNFIVSLPLLAKFALHSGAQGLGILTACMGVGSVTGAAYLARRSFQTYSLMLMGAGIFSVFLGLLSLSPWFPLTCAVLVGVGFTSTMCNATANTLLQMSTPDELRGRVLSIYFLLLAGSTPIGGYLTGYLTDHFQIRPTLGIEAEVCIVGVAWAIFYYRRRHLRSLDIEAEAGGSPKTLVRGG